jgi:hypothetical protein
MEGSTTDVLFVLPGWGNSNNFRVKTDGSVLINHYQDIGAYDPLLAGNNPLNDGWFYKSHVNPGPGIEDEFPTSPRDTIFLTTGDKTWEEVAELKYNYIHPRDATTNSSTLSSRIGPPMQWMPYTQTKGSVYGVNGYFNPGETFISTRSEEGVDTTSIVQIGEVTNNQDRFQIFSSGMLKNYRVGIGTNDFAKVLNIGNTDGKAPGFHLSNDSMPLYIIHDGAGDGIPFCGGLVFNYPGVDSVSVAIDNATGKGDLHIQSTGYIKFLDNNVENGYIKTPLRFKFPENSEQENEIKILSDTSFIYIQNELIFQHADSAHLTIWARGKNDGTRGKVDVDGCAETGGIVFDKSIDLLFEGGSAEGNGVVLIRSEHDDVIIKSGFSYNNQNALEQTGKLMIQAGQDVVVTGNTQIIQDGKRSILYEAKRSIALDTLNVVMGGSDIQHGDLTIKAGYPFFLETSEIVNPIQDLWGVGTCVTGSYSNRNGGASHTGGDIWFKGPVNITMTPVRSDSVDIYIRAFNSIHVDSAFLFSLAGLQRFTSSPVIADTTLAYAETGNYEAISVDKKLPGDSIRYSFSANDSVYFLLQAGNRLGYPCGASLCIDSSAPIYNVDRRWNGNILFGENRTFTLRHAGVGPTLISAARDIENQPGANFTFDYTSTDLGVNDSILITAGRHIETHAPYWFNYNGMTGITNSVTMRAGHQAGGCDWLLCKGAELASNLAYNYNYNPVTPKEPNIFAQGGSGHGSILLFDSVKFDYIGKGNILMTALNGNIESDPYLHGVGYKGGAPILFNHEGSEGKVRMEAIDIKLHDILQYNGGASATGNNGNFTMAAFDSILTRSLYYNNNTDNGNVYITTDKYKVTGENCGSYDRSNSVIVEGQTLSYPRGIHQGHIVLGYGADCDNRNENDSIVFDFSGNPNTAGANLYIRAGYEGFEKNPVTGKANRNLFDVNSRDRGKGYGGNITFDFMKITMGPGNKTLGGYAEISTPNGNIWGKDSLEYTGRYGYLLIDAGLGSKDDTLRNTRWSGFPDGNRYGAGTEDMLNTYVPFCCDEGGEWRTGNIMLKGGSVDFAKGDGNATIRTREGFIDVYDRFDARNMEGHLLMYAGSDDPSVSGTNEWGDVSHRDFQYTPTANSGSVYFGADDNIMLNYGYSNGREQAYMFGGVPGVYDVAFRSSNPLAKRNSPYYYTPYKGYIDDCYASYHVGQNGYLWYRVLKKDDGTNWASSYHRMYRGCTGIPGQTPDCDNLGRCTTIPNGARDLVFNFDRTADGDRINSGGLAAVATNYIDMFTRFFYTGGQGSGIHAVPGMSTLRGENVKGYGLYIKSTFDGVAPEKRRVTCETCGDPDGDGWTEWPAITFHDDARIKVQNQTGLIESQVIEIFGHAEFDAWTDRGSKTKLTVRADSLVFHDSVIFAGPVELVPLTTDAVKRYDDMRLGVINDLDGRYYQPYGPAIRMEDRKTPIFELGYQRCAEPGNEPNPAPNKLSEAGLEPTPSVGGDIIVTFKHGFSLPIYNTVVANHARISFTTDSVDGVRGGEYIETFIRTDLLRIRNKVEFYTDPAQPDNLKGTFKMTSHEQMPSISASGMYPKHLHMEPGSELSIPGEDSLTVIATTAIGGFGHIHENVFIKANGIIAPGYASLMEWDCQTGHYQGRLSIHDLVMEKDAVMRISLGNKNYYYDPVTGTRYRRTQTDTLHVAGSIIFFGKIPLHVLPDDQYVEPGCYLFMEYDDTDGSSFEYVKNLELAHNRFGEYYFTLDKSERGRIYLCVTTFPDPPIQRYIMIHPADGVTTDPQPDIHHYVPGHHSFTFRATFADNTPVPVYATGVYSRSDVILPATHLYGNTYQYWIYQVTEPWDVAFGAPYRSDVSNPYLPSQKVWSYKNSLYVNVEQDDVVSVYTMTGILYRKMEIPAGQTALRLERGMYLVTLKNGAVYKITVN